MASWRMDSGSKGRCKTWWNGRARTGKHAARMSGIAPLHCRWCMRVLLDLQVAWTLCIGWWQPSRKPLGWLLRLPPSTNRPPPTATLSCTDRCTTTLLRK
jgi:hypothetical protein